MDHATFSARQFSMQAKWCNAGWILSCKVMIVNNDATGVKWVTLFEDVELAFEGTGKPEHLAKALLERMKSKI